ncbi:MAG: metal-dependent hydrolase [Desulfomonilaceae bacterium]
MRVSRLADAQPSANGSGFRRLSFAPDTLKKGLLSSAGMTKVAMLLGHIAVATIAKQTIFHQRSFFFLLGASVMPDLIDKPAQIFFDLPGRGVGHSLVVFVAAACLALMVSSRLKLPKGLVTAGLCLWFSHLAGDFLEWHILLWPFYKAPVEPYPRFDLLEKLYQFYVARMWPEQFWLEMICIAAAALIFAIKSYRIHALSHER